MIDERLKKYFTIVRHYHGQDHRGRRQMLQGFFTGATVNETDPKTRSLLVQFQLSESKKYVPANQSPEPPRFA